jgi:hypothetical protein
MRKNFVSLSVIALLVATFSACSTHSGMVNYNDYKRDMVVKKGDVKGEKIGHVEASAGGAVWNKCPEKAADALHEVILRAKSMGGNALGNVTWSKGESTEAVCKKGWGWTVLTPFIFTPLFMSTHVQGDVYKTGGKVSSELIPLPNNNAEEKALIQKLISKL